MKHLKMVSKKHPAMAAESAEGDVLQFMLCIVSGKNPLQCLLDYLGVDLTDLFGADIFGS